MAKAASKKEFIEKLRFRLSFHFYDNERESILNDYEEWFENESLQGKTEEEICAALQDPAKVVKNLLAESGGNAGKRYIVFHNDMARVLLLMAMHLLAGVWLLKICNDHALSYLCAAIGINFLYFFMGLRILKTPCCFSWSDYKGNLPIAGMTLLVILSEAFLLPRMVWPYSGNLCVLAAGAVSAVLFAANIYTVIKNGTRNEHVRFLTVFHISGVITILFFLTNQLHMLYRDVSENRKLVCGSLCIYAEIAVLCAAFAVLRKDGKGRKG